MLTVGEKKVKVLKWNAMAIWSYSGGSRLCTICRNHIYELCIQCMGFKQNFVVYPMELIGRCKLSQQSKDIWTRYLKQCYEDDEIVDISLLIPTLCALYYAYNPFDQEISKRGINKPCSKRSAECTIINCLCNCLKVSSLCPLCNTQ